MRLRHIEVFHAVYSSGSMTQAAKILHVSQPSVSKVLAHAELQLGFSLFARVKGKLAPTPEAERLYKHVQTLFEDLGRVKRVASNLQEGAEGRIRVASTPAMGMNMLPALVGEYMRKNSHVVFEMETMHQGELIGALEESRIDLALAFDPASSPSITETKIAQGDLVLITPKGYLHGKPTPIRLMDLVDIPFIRLNSRSPLGRLLEAHIDGVNVELSIIAITETYHLAGALVAQGVGVAIVDQITAKYFKNADIEIIKLDPSLTYNISMLQLNGVPLSRVCQKFKTHLTELISNEFNPTTTLK